ncbi:MAG: DUF447 family protein [Gemmataceae bacterium]|nr:DUF447 family protein [Gemmataceae bacterium]
MILEGLVTTLGPEDRLHVAPMGPRVEPELLRFQLRPYPTSNTFQNLTRHPEGVFHVTDDVLQVAQGAIGILANPPAVSASVVRGLVLSGACRAYEFKVTHRDTSEDRARLECEVVKVHRFRDFLGFNRARHAVVEAAILASRTALLPLEEISAEFKKLSVLVQKTGGEAEAAAFSLLERYLRDQFPLKNKRESRNAGYPL